MLILTKIIIDNKIKKIINNKMRRTIIYSLLKMII
jgi:hypothetical protein